MLSYKLWHGTVQGTVHYGTYCIPRLWHRPVEAPRFGESAHGNHRSENVDALFALAAWAVWCEEKSCSKHEIAAQRRQLKSVSDDAWEEQENKPQYKDTSAMVIGLRLNVGVR